MTIRRLGKKFIWVVACIFLLLACLAPCGSAMEAKVLYNGKCTLDLTVSKERMQEYGVTDLDGFKPFFEGYMYAINEASGVSVDQDMVVASGYKETGSEYLVSVKTRRLDKLLGVGSIDYRDASVFESFDAEMDILRSYSNGKIWSDRDFICVNYPREENDPKTYRVSLSDKDKNNLDVLPVEAKTGKTVFFDDFSDYLADTSDKIVVFRLFNFMFADSLTLTVGGTLRYYSTGCISTEDGKMLTITPVAFSHTRNVLNEDTQEVEAVNETYSSMVGYFTYTPAMAPIAIVGIVFGSLLGVVLVVFVALVIVCVYKERDKKRIARGVFHNGADCAGGNELASPSAVAGSFVVASVAPNESAASCAVAESSIAASGPSAGGIGKTLKGLGERGSVRLAAFGRSVAKHKLLYLMIIPGLALLILFHYLPLMGLVTAFQDYDVFDGYASEFVGLRNFKRIFYAISASQMYQIFRNTIFISLIRVASNFPIILALALVVNSIKNRRFRSVFQNISFIPYFISWTAASGMAYALLNTNQGLLNDVLMRLGMESVVWYNTPSAWWTILAVSSLWKGAGWGTLIYIAAMCNIDPELYEACALDGGGIFRQIISVTIPAIMNIICLQLILDVSSIMKDNYEQILALVPGDTTQLKSTIDVIGKFTYSQLGSSGMGAATAMGLIQSVIGLILVIVTNRIVVKSDNEGIM